MSGFDRESLLSLVKRLRAEKQEADEEWDRADRRGGNMDAETAACAAAAQRLEDAEKLIAGLPEDG